MSEEGNNIDVPFQHDYAMLVLHLDTLNQELKFLMDQVLIYITSVRSNFVFISYMVFNEA